ncbi:MAG: pyruvate dehydrogenase (acetyl-transferring) E1 component subunit alpha [Amnibacterium sp.]
MSHTVAAPRALRTPEQDPALRGAVRILSPDGERRADPEYGEHVADVDDEALAALYEDMVVVRRIDTEATNLQRQGELALWPPLLGQEAAQIGSARAMRPDDFAFTSYRENGVAYCRGVTPAQLMPVWRGVTASGWDPYSVNMATPQVIIAAQTLHATGYALGLQYDGSDAAAIAYFGDGATSEGDASEALVFAATYTAPVVFFCQNNHWAISEPVTLQSGSSLAGRAAGFGVPSVTVDGNDVLAVLAVTRAAFARARAGGGPSFIEAVTYRMGPHTTADDPSRYRDAAEVEAWRRLDPIDRVRIHLESRGALPEDRKAAVQAHADQVARAMRAACTALPEPDPLSLFEHVYATDHPGIERQRARYSRDLDSFEDAR